MAERLDREAVDRILDRAHQLDASMPVADSGVEPEALIAAASEVGIDPNAVRDSLAIERLSISPPPTRRLDGLAGASEVVVEREVHLTVDQTLAGLEAWFTSPHRLICDRRSEGVLFARRRSDASAKVGRTFSTARGEGRLEAASLTVEAVPQIIGSTPAQPKTLVRISADRAAPRQLRLAGGGGLAGLGVAGGAMAASIEVIAMPMVALPLMVGGYVVARSGSGQADRLELELERLLSRVERGEQPAGLLGRMARRARRAANRAS